MANSESVKHRDIVAQETERPALVVEKCAPLEWYKTGTAVAGALASLTTLLCVLWLRRRRQGRKASQLPESPGDKRQKQSGEERVPVVVIREGRGMGAEALKVEASEISSLYEDVLSQNFIDVLFVKSPQEGKEIYPVNLASSPPKENLLEPTLTSDENEPNAFSSGKDDITEPGEKDEIIDPGEKDMTDPGGRNEVIDHTDQRTASNLSGHDAEEVKEPSPEVKPLPIPELGEFVTTKMFNLIEEEKKESFEKIEEMQTGFDERLNNLEDKTNECNIRVEDIERTTRKWYQRIEFIEAELAELHDKMYTLLTKLEEKPKQNYIGLSSMAKEAAMLEQDALNGIFDVETTIAKYITQGFVVNDRRCIGQASKGSLEKLKYLEDLPEQDTQNAYVGTSTSSRSIGLEAELQYSCPKSPLKKAKFKVPPHVLPPYKRSSYTSTASVELPKPLQKLKKRYKELDRQLRSDADRVDLSALTALELTFKSQQDFDEKPLSEWDLPAKQDLFIKHPEINEQDLLRKESNEVEMTMTYVEKHVLKKENNINSLITQEDLLKESKEKKKKKKQKCRWTAKD